MQFKHLMRLARNEKQDAVADDPHGEAMPPHQLAFGRGGRLVALTFCYEPSISARILRVGIPGFGADEAAIISDAVGTSDDMRRPLRWGELQDRWEAGDRDDLYESMMVMHAFRRQPNISSAHLHYQHDRDAGTITWTGKTLESKPRGPDRPRGRMVRVIDEGFDEPHDLDDIAQIYKDLGTDEPGWLDYKRHGLTRKEARMHADCGMMRALLFLGCPVLISAGDEEDAAILDQSLANIEEEGAVNPDALADAIRRMTAREEP